ncbi:DUF6301 family protein [Nocardia sp. NBC_01503]|uniref:DUF6301 family protein n=1 Tax=Nocardia sp. NBC_01503 TaxID=2975997 RepID=UPI002E7AE32E|nr:DUF6301 family protein [Nocardia sp. NBC_01503]WTL29284.1 DUF6301 family protein [Nocardia sp. NBC_01503]
MQVDIDKIAEKVSVAARFDWTWTDADLDRFCAAEGWRIAERTGPSAVLTTDLKLPRPEAWWRAEDGRVNRVLAFVADGLDATDSETLRRVYDQFADISSAVESVVGPPTDRKAGADGEIRWALPKVVITLRLVKSTSLFLHFTNPEYQAWLDAPDEEAI